MMIFQKRYAIFLLIIVTGACNQNSEVQQEAPATLMEIVSDTTVAWPEPGLNFGPPVSYVKTDTNEIVKILNTTTYHADEVNEEMLSGTWYGLYEDESGYFIEETDVTAERVYDAIADENENIKTGWEIADAHPSPAIILMNGIEPNQQIINQIELSAREIFPGDTVAFMSYGIMYQLYASGDKIEASFYYNIENYKLFLKAEKDSVIINQLLVEHAGFDDAMVDILFVGDIDGDKIPDLLIDTGRHYNVTNPTLYLSSGAADNALLQIVGWHYSVGC